MLLSPRLAWIARRVLLGMLTLLIVSMLIFAATQALPGDVAQMMLGKDATPEQLALVRSQMGLDQPVIVQYLNWLAGVLQGDFGTSVASQRPVMDLIGPRIANSFTLVWISMALAIPASAVLGTVTAYLKDSAFDKACMGLSLAVNAVPEFVLALLLVVLLSTNIFHLLPAVSILSPDLAAWRQPQALVLPVVTLFLLQSTYLYRLVRGSMLDVLSMDYIQFAELKGLPSRRILLRHALPNAVVPAIQAAANVFALSVGGVVLVEYVFGFPGVGTALTDAVGNRDLPVVQAVVLTIASTFFIANMVADIAAAILTPPGRGAGH